MSFGRNPRAIFVSVVVFIAAFSASVPLYRQLNVEKSSPEEMADLEYGTHGYLLRDKTPDKHCIGWVRYDLQYDAGYSLLSSGRISYVLQGERNAVQFSLGASFNSLDQLAGVVFRVKVGGNEIHGKAEGVTLIQVSIEGVIEGQSIAVERTLQGPMMIYEVQPNQFLLRGEFFPQMEKITERFGPLPISAPFLLDEREEGKGDALEEECENDEGDALPMDEIYSIVQRIKSFL